MNFSLSTRWNAGRHTSGQQLITEILELGFKQVELSYDLTLDRVPEIRDMVQAGAVSISSVHAFCPVPVGAPYGHPELFALTDLSERNRQSAVLHLLQTVIFAAEMQAPCVVAHAGRVEMPHLTAALIALIEKGQLATPRYERTKYKLIDKRARKAGKYLKALYQSVEELLPELEEKRVKLAFENLPYWEAMPTEMELHQLLQHFDSPWLAYWHDVGHGQIRENLGLINQVTWLKLFKGRLAGMHLHDVLPPAFDHLMPPKGNVDFSIFTDAVQPDTILVLEPAPGASAEELTTAVKLLDELWCTARSGG